MRDRQARNHGCRGELKRDHVLLHSRPPVHLSAQCDVLSQHDLARDLRLGVGSRKRTARLPVCAARLGVHRPIVPLSRPAQKRDTTPSRTDSRPRTSATGAQAPGAGADDGGIRPRAAAERESLPAGGGSVAGTPAEEIIVVATASPGRR